MDFIKKNLSNILFFAFFIFLFTPYGLPVRAFLIKGVSFVTTRVFNMEIAQDERVVLNNYDWQLVDADGVSLNFNAFKNKVVVVNYWATWCPPCIAEMPSFQNLYDAYKDDIVFLFVANDEQNKVDKFMKKKGYELPIYYQVSQSPSQMSSNALPTTYIINESGEIVVEKTGAADWNSGKVRDLLDKLIQ